MLDRCPEYPLYPHSSLDLSGYRKVLVLAPHPDDEIYGCGGLLRLLVEAGADVSVLVITDGGQGGSGPPAEVRAVRMAESRASARVVGFERIRFMGLEDRSRLTRPSRRRAMTASGKRISWTSVRPFSRIDSRQRPSPRTSTSQRVTATSIEARGQDATAC